MAGGVREFKPNTWGAGFSGSRRKVGKRSKSAFNARVISSRARCWPMQICGPWPKATWRAVLRPMSKSSGLTDRAGSRFADAWTTSIFAPAGMATPSRTTSRVATRVLNVIGGSQRRASSMASGTKERSRRTASSCSGMGEQPGQKRAGAPKGRIASSVHQLTQKGNGDNVRQVLTVDFRRLRACRSYRPRQSVRHSRMPIAAPEADRQSIHPFFGTPRAHERDRYRCRSYRP